MVHVGIDDPAAAVYRFSSKPLGHPRGAFGVVADDGEERGVFSFGVVDAAVARAGNVSDVFIPRQTRTDARAE